MWFSQPVKHSVTRVQWLCLQRGRVAFKSRSTFHGCLRLLKNKQLLNLWPLKSISSQQCGVLGQLCTFANRFSWLWRRKQRGGKGREIRVSLELSSLWVTPITGMGTSIKLKTCGSTDVAELRLSTSLNTTDCPMHLKETKVRNLISCSDLKGRVEFLTVSTSRHISSFLNK